MNKPLFISLVVCGLLIGGAFFFVSLNSPPSQGGTPPAIVDGVQVINITAKGGYSPRVIVAKANVPSIVRITTNGTFDCSASVVIPKLGYQKFLKPSGTEDITLSAEQATGTLKGICSMGMYNFQITFQ